MADYTLHCFGESGNAYKAALMLELCRLDWRPVWVDFFNGETRREDYRKSVNEMGEAPVLVHGAMKLTQSGVILDYLAEQTRKFCAKSEAERREIWRWILFDNHKFTANLATLRFLMQFAKTGETPVTEFLRSRCINALKIVDGHLAQTPFIIGKRDDRGSFNLRLSVLRRGIDRAAGQLQSCSQLAGPHQGPARLETPIQSDAAAEDLIRKPGAVRGRTD